MFVVAAVVETGAAAAAAVVVENAGPVPWAAAAWQSGNSAQTQRQSCSPAAETIQWENWQRRFAAWMVGEKLACKRIGWELWFFNFTLSQSLENAAQLAMSTEGGAAAKNKWAHM